MNADYGALVGFPLLASISLLAAAAGALLLRGARLTHQKKQLTTSYVGDVVLGFRWSVWVLIVTIVFLAANHLLVRGVAIGRWDVDGQFFPYYVLVADHARAASLVQWDPWSSGGLPMLGDPQVGAFSPVNFVLGLITGGTSWGFRLYWLLLWWIGGFGMLMLGRHLSAPAWGACVVALGFLLCGVYTGNAEHTSWITAFSFLPITIWRLDVALASRKLWPAAEAGAAWGLSALAGHPALIIITGCFAGLWALGRWLVDGSWAAERGGRRSDQEATARRLTLGFVLSALFGVLLVGGIILLPTYVAFFFEGAGTNSRVGALSREIALSNSLEPGALATFASPYLTALKVVHQFMPAGVSTARLWPSTDASMVNVYAGAIIPALALFALIRRAGDRWRWWVAGLGLLSLACAMGEALPVRGWLYDWLPPMRFFRHAAVFRLYYVFALCILALIATRDLAVDLRKSSPGILALFPVASIVVASCAALTFIPLVNSAWSGGMPEKAVLLGRLHFIWVWVGICLVGFLGWRLPSRWREWCVPVLLITLAASDAVMTSVLSIPTLVRVGEEAQRWKHLDALHNSNLDLTANGLRRQKSSCEPAPLSVRCRSNDQLITKVPVLESYSTDKNPFHLAMIHHPVLNGMATGAERIWFSKQVSEVRPTEATFGAFQRRAEILGAPPFVIHEAGNLLRGNPPTEVTEAGINRIEQLPAAERIRADVVRYKPGELVVDVYPTDDGWLLVTDRWARSWQAELNGHRVPLYVGNFIFRAIRVPEGENRVRFTYRPLGFPWLVIVSWGMLAAVLLFSLRLSHRF
jgi:hypothetical protein